MRCGFRRLPFLRPRHSMAVVLALIAAGCSESTVTEIAGPSAATKCQTALTGLPASFPPSGARLNATVSTTRECQWRVESEAPWVQITPASGQGEASVSVVVAENPAAIARSAAMLVNGSRVTVSQDAAPCRFDLNSTSVRVSPEGGPIEVAVSAVPGCVWRASSEVPWVRVVSPEVTGSGSAEFVVDVNTNGERTATLRIAGLAFLVQQAAAAPAPAPTPTPTPTPPPTPAPSPTPTPGPAPSPPPTPGPAPSPPPTPSPPPAPTPSPTPAPTPTPTPTPAPLTLVMEPSTMPIGYNGQPFPGLTLRAQGGTGPYRFTGTNLLGWPSSLDYHVEPVAGTAHWHGTVTREGEFPVRMVVEDSDGARRELMLTFVFRPAPAQ